MHKQSWQPSWRSAWLPSMGAATSLFDQLLATGKVAALYDPSDLSSLYTDAAGTALVDADGDTVGLMLDKSQMDGKTAGQFLVAQPNLIDLSTQQLASATVVEIDDELEVTATSNYGHARIPLPTEINKSYLFTADIEAVSTTYMSSEAYIQKSDATGNLEIVTSDFVVNADGKKSVSLFFEANVTTTYLRLIVHISGDTFNFTNIRCVEVSGKAAVQSVVAARPLYHTDGSLKWIESDGIDDSLNWDAPAGTYTIGYIGKTSPATILTGQSLSGATDVFLNTEISKYVAMQDGLTAQETALLTGYLEEGL